MENKCLKTDVFVNENVFTDSCEQPIDVDFTLPDYCPDISKIFSCRAAVRISSKGINGKNISIDGNVSLTLLYCDRDNKLCSYEYQYPFNKTKEMPNEFIGANLVCSAKCEYINCRAVTGRKVDIHGAVSLNMRVFKKKLNQVISDYDDCNLELKRSLAPATIPIGYSEKYLIIEEEIAISSGQSPIKNILRYCATPCVKESKILNDKIMVKGEMCITIVYCPEGAFAPQILKTTLPFSQIVDLQGISDTCECETKASLSFLEIKPRLSSMGGNRSFSINAKLLLCCEGYCGNDIAVIEDAFSTKFLTNITKNNITFSKITNNFRETCHFKKSVEFSEEIANVLDLWCDLQSKNVKFQDDCMILNATFKTSFIVANENNEVSFFEKMIDFEYKFNLDNPSDSMACNPDIDITMAGYTITSANTIEVRIDLLMNASVYKNSNMSLITEMDVDKNNLINRNRNSAMTIYFAIGKENIWDIARKYSASVDEIIKINELEKDFLEEGNMILVPLA